MKLLTNNISFNERDIKSIKQAIYKLYDEYKIFINCPDMPKFDVRLYKITSTEGAQAYVSLSDNSDTPYVLNICIDLLIKTSYKMVPTLYHEFTHIYDLEHYGLDIELEKRASYIDMFTEFHATTVQLRKACGFSSNDTTKKLSLNDKITDISPKIKTIEDYIQAKNVALAQSIDGFNQNPSQNTLDKAIDYTVYVIANKHFINTYMGENTFNMRDFLPAINLFGNELAAIDLFLSTEINTDEALKFLFESYVNIRHKLLS